MEGAQEPVGCRQHRDPAAQPGSPGTPGERKERGPSVSCPQASVTEFRTRQVHWFPGLLTTRQVLTEGTAAEAHARGTSLPCSSDHTSPQGTLGQESVP